MSLPGKVRYVLRSANRVYAPVAQRIEHLPCGSLNEENELIEWTVLYAGTPLEPSVLKRF
jgi:hypothetical protein